MSPSRKAPRYAHSDGYTGLCYSTDGKNLVTCGSEGDIRIWHGFEDDDPTETCVGEKAFAVAQVGDKLYVGTDHNNVQLFSFPEPELDRICTRFTAPVTCISIVKDWMVAGSSDMMVHVFNLSSGVEKVLDDHGGPILEVALDPKMEYLASSCCDGLVRVYSMDMIINDKQSVPLYTWPDFIQKSNDFETSPVFCRIAWSPNEGQFLAIPNKYKIHLYERNTWNLHSTLAYDGCEFQVVRFSNCGKFLAAGGSEGEIIVWKVDEKSVLYHSNGESKMKICSLEWNPVDLNEIAYCDTEGQLGLIESVLSENKSLINGHTLINNQNEVAMDDEVYLDDDFNGGMDIEDRVNDDDDDDDDNVISLDKIKAQSGFIPDDERASPRPSSFPDLDDADRQTPTSGVYHPTVPQVEIQQPFQPTSTPTHFQYRFMVYNDIGMVRHTNTEEENSIDVEFHDSAVHHSFRINNIVGHSLAALSTKALVLASEKYEEKPSKLACIVINSWDGSKEWSIDLQDEEILAVASGDSFVAAATDKRLLRIFTIGGCQREILSLPGPVLCLNARDNWLVAICHSGLGVSGDVSLCYVIYPIGALHRTKGPLPLPMSPKSTLRWAGFSEEGSFLTLDSDSVLRLCQSSNVWRPVAFMDDLTKGPSDHYFVVGVSESTQLVRCILCKGSFYPPTVPRPILTQVSWKIPLCEINTEKGELEEQFWRKQLAVSCLPPHKIEEIGSITKEIITSAVKLFALSCKTDNEMRAIELCEMFTNPQFLLLVTRYATSTGKTNLSEKISELNSPIIQHASRHRSPSPPGYRSENNDHHSNGQFQSQDMFGEDSYQPTAETSNIILAMKQKQVVIKPQNIVLGRLNPFKKQNSEEKLKTDIISELSAKSQVKPIESQEDPKENAIKVQKEKKITKPQIKFTEWFSKEKENLENEFPELDKTQLNKVALKRFKELNTQHKTTSLPPAGPQLNSVRNFFSTRKTTDDKTATQDTENSQDSTVIPSSQELTIKNDENENMKKRKVEDEDNSSTEPNSKRPLKAANKLQAFSFNK